MKRPSIKLSVGTILLSVSIVACTTLSQPPNALLSEAESEIKLAEEVGAREVAPLAYRSASENLAAAKKSMQHEKYEEARILLERALAEAEFAAAKAMSEKAESASEQVDDNLKALKEVL